MDVFFCAVSAGGGARTHTALRPLDFESSASASSATPAAGVGKVSRHHRSSSASGIQACCPRGKQPPCFFELRESQQAKARWLHRLAAAKFIGDRFYFFCGDNGSSSTIQRGQRRSAVRSRSLRAQLRRIACGHQRALLLCPAKEEILTHLINGTTDLRLLLSRASAFGL